MINFTITDDAYKNDLDELIRPFEQRTDESFSVHLTYQNSDGELKVEITSDKLNGFCKTYRFPFSMRSYGVSADEALKAAVLNKKSFQGDVLNLNSSYGIDFSDKTDGKEIDAESTEEPTNADSGKLEFKREEKRLIKIALYRTLAFLTGANLPYGCLTGIRPTKLYTEMLNLGIDAHEVFRSDYSVADNKLALIEKTVQTQLKLLNAEENACDIFVFIPFCPTKCAYCSFVSFPLDKQKHLINPYCDHLITELKLLKKIVKQRSFSVRSVYVGGGTPTCLPPEVLDKILAECRYKKAEFTVEAGRPDTITPEILDVLKKRKVTRVSVNPQTFNDDTLKRIGRVHTSEDTERAYRLCKERKLDVNMDLIAMLPGESFEDFKYTVDRVAYLSPENVTVHTLYLKKGSELKLAGYRHTDGGEASEMVDYAYEKLSDEGYAPYYMYRQKYTSGNLENAGYAKSGKECIYNVDIMEENTSILAAGANAISKKWTKNLNLIERNANYKHPLEYIKHFDTVIEKQKRFWGVKK